MRRRALLSALGLAMFATTTMAAESDRPVDRDERGIWMAFDEAERELRHSDFLIRDSVLDGYLRSVLCRLLLQPAQVELVHLQRAGAVGEQGEKNTGSESTRRQAAVGGSQRRSNRRTCSKQ